MEKEQELLDGDVLTVGETDAEFNEENTAFEAAFAKESGIKPGKVKEEVAPEPELETHPVVTEVPDPEVVEVADPAPRLIGGLTEEQIAAALGRSASLQGTVDKMAGRIGSLMQQIEQLRAAPPTTAAGQQALDLKLEKLSGSFPELAELLREDLQGLRQGSSAPPAPAGISQEELAQQLAATANKFNEKLEVKVLTIQHPDWFDLIRTPEFANFRDNVLPTGVGKQLMESEDSVFISGKLTEFKAWKERVSAPPAAPAPRQQNSRVSNAVLPTGRVAPVTGVATEEDAFLSGFKNERARSGY